ncbi:Protein of unknown function [Bacillus mycoides]|nr:Protein of unknown function [Bacillus mycoides]SCM87695.1 Protein of unknown function [Bacillus mycoides]
MKNIASKH